MSRTQTMIALVIATPGIRGQEIAALMGLTTRDDIKSMTTQLSQLCKSKKLRKDGILAGSVSRPRYWPTEFSTVDLRSHPSRHAKRSAAAKVASAKRNAGKPPAETRAVRRARAAEARPRVKAIKAPRDRIIAPPRGPQGKPPPNTQSVAEFLQKGGQIQYLPPHASSNPLQFDHSATEVPIRNRRQATPVRPAPGR